jgi:hypothetical protein
MYICTYNSVVYHQKIKIKKFLNFVWCPIFHIGSLIFGLFRIRGSVPKYHGSAALEKHKLSARSTCSSAVAIFLFCLAAALSSMPHFSFSLAMLSLSSCACSSILAFSLANPSRSLAAASLALSASSSASAFFFSSSASSRQLAAFAFLAWCHRIKKVKETRIIVSYSKMNLP